MKKELVQLLARVELPETSLLTVRIPNEQVIAFNREVALYGFTLGGDVTEHLGGLSAAEFRAARKELLALLAKISGATENHQVLFNGFPYRMPDQDEYLMRRVIGFLENAFSVFSDLTNLKSLSCGHFIDGRLFDITQFGACPICQRQVPECTGVDEVEYSFDNVTPLKVLHLATKDGLREAGNALLSRNSSLSADEKTLLVSLHTKVGLTPPETVFRETLPFVYVLFGDLELTRSHIVGATDVLRIATYLSDPLTGDLSLSENTRFKISTRHAKRLLSLLEGLENCAEDMLRHRERWLRLGEVLHPGSAKNRARFPLTATDFDLLRRAPQTISTFNGEVEVAVRGRMIDERVLRLLSTRPGEFLRRLDALLRFSADPKAVIETFERIAPKMTTRALLGIIPYLISRKRQGRPRVFFPKGVASKVQIVEDNRLPIADAVLNEARAVAQVTLLNRFNELPEMGKVYIDPALMGVVVPFNRRGDASTLVPVSKGSRYPIGEGKVVRLFTHWIGDGIDVDLSTRMFGEDMSDRGHIGWTNLGATGFAHSGDIQSAPNGAAEFVDIDLDIARRNKDGIRYIAVSIISFRGQTFDTFPCFAGFMTRDALKSGQRFEPASVRLKFDVSAKAAQHMPLILDVKTGEIIYTDLVVGGGRHAAVTRQFDKFRTLLGMALDLVNTKPTVYDLLTLHAMTRGSIVEDPAEADIVFKADEIDLHTLVSDYTA